MATEHNDLYTTHLNRRFRKRALVNAGAGIALAALCGSAYVSAEGASIMALVGVLLGVIFFVLPIVTIFGARHPLRLTEKGVVTRYSITTETVIPWTEIAGIGIHPGRKDSCLLRQVPGAAPQPVAIGWTMIWESEAEVMAALKAALAKRGHVFAEEPEEAPPTEPQLVNPLKNFWS